MTLKTAIIDCLKAHGKLSSSAVMSFLPDAKPSSVRGALSRMHIYGVLGYDGQYWIKS